MHRAEEPFNRCDKLLRMAVMTMLKPKSLKISDINASAKIQKENNWNVNTIKRYWKQAFSKTGKMGNPNQGQVKGHVVLLNHYQKTKLLLLRLEEKSHN